MIDRPNATEPAVRPRPGSRLNLAIAGGSLRAASILRLLNDIDNLFIVGIADRNRSAPGMRLADEMGVFSTAEVSELFQIPDLDLIIDLSDDPTIQRTLREQKPERVELLGGRGSEMVWDLLVAKKRGEEQEKLFVELQVAYDKIRSHERQLQASKEALERANEKLEGRLAEIFFTHEFFKALTSFTSVGDVTSLIVDGANGILGAEISCVYLLDAEAGVLNLTASQGRPPEAFVAEVSAGETILGRAMWGEPVQQTDTSAERKLAGWARAIDEVRSQAAIPLRTGDNLIGVLVVASSTYRELVPSEMERLQVIGNQASLALQNALLHQELERLSVTDRLTELYNHGYFQQRLEEEIARAARFDHEVSLIMLDIDDFKEFNDAYGHPHGDRVLRAVSAIIKENLREMDIAARYGGEEFVIVLPETDNAGACGVGERIRERMAEMPFVGSGTLPPVHKTISVGVATYPSHAASHSALVEAADKAMYAAKRSGKNKVVCADDL